MNEEKPKINLKILLDYAERATPGPWYADLGNWDVESQHEKHWRMTVCEQSDLMSRHEHFKDFDLEENPPDAPRHPGNDLEYIAAANPETVLALVTALREAMRTLTIVTEAMCNTCHQDLRAYEALTKIKALGIEV